MTEDDGFTVPPFPAGALGWNVYYEDDRFAFVPNEEVLSPAAQSFADEVEAFTAAEASCGATLFTPEIPLMRLIAMEGIPMHPLHLVYCDPVQGPTPLACMREPHPGSPYHWDGAGTWWR